MDYVIKDAYRLQLSDESKGIKDSVLNGLTVIKDAAGAPALEVSIDATHGGYINQNYSYYLPDGQQKGAPSWYTPYPKPVLTEHNDELSPIGRVIESQFITIPEDNNQPASEFGKPRCKIQLKAIISDMESIQKIMDGRFMTVSISGKPKATPKCSICHEDIESFMGCDEGHIRGKKYDNKICYYEVGEMVYSEVSFVNKPADQSDTHVAIITGMKAVQNPTLSESARIAMEEAIQKIKEEKKVLAKDSVQEPPKETPAPAAETPTEVKPADAEEPCPECEDSYWTAEEKKEIAADSAEYDKWLESDAAGDAKLTSEQRKGMKASTFCGPDRSYPVPDCKHAANAKARCTQAVKSGKMSTSAAAKVRACISRKEKALGCGGDSTGDLTKITVEILEEVRKALADEVAGLIAQRVEIDSQLASANEKITKTLEQVTKTQEELKKLQETSAAEIAQVKQAAESQHAQNLQQAQELTQGLKESMVKNIIMTNMILGKEGVLTVFAGTKAEERIKSYATRADSFKNSTIQDLTKQEKELFDELTKKVLVKVDIGAPEGVIGDKYLTQAKQQADKAKSFQSWFDSKKS